MAGYVYAVCTAGNYHNVKNGFTTVADPFQYINNQYARTMVPLEVIDVVPVVKACSMEKLSRIALAPYRIADNHEVFDLGDEHHQFRREVWDYVARMLRELNIKSKLTMPEDPSTVLARREAEREERRQAAEHKETLNQFAAESRCNRQERRARRKAESEGAKMRRKQAKEDRVREREALKLAKAQEAQDKLDDLLKDFIAEHCTVGREYKAETTGFLESFNATTDVLPPVTSQAMAAMMKRQGYEKRRDQAVIGRPHVFLGIASVQDSSSA